MTGIVLAAVFFSGAGLAKRVSAEEAEASAEDVVRALAADIWSARDDTSDAIARRRRLTSAIESSTNVELLSRLVLGRHWRGLAPEQRAEYRSLFANVVIGGLAARLETLVRGLDGPLEEHFAITKSAATGKRDTLVRSKVVATNGQPLTVDWRMRHLDKGPVIIDLVVEGVSLLVSQRAEFAAVIERGRIDGLIATLRRRAQAAN